MLSGGYSVDQCGERLDRDGLFQVKIDTHCLCVGAKTRIARDHNGMCTIFLQRCRAFAQQAGAALPPDVDIADEDGEAVAVDERMRFL